MKDEFSVYVFYRDDFHDRTHAFVGAETAVKAAHRLTESLGATIGMIRRIIITDGGDHTVFEWKYGEGITFPTPEMRKATA